MTDYDLRPDLDRYTVMKGDPWSLACYAGPEDAPEDITGAVIVAAGRWTDGPDKGERFDLDVVRGDETAGEFHIGVEAATYRFDYAVTLAPAGGLGLTRWRGTVTPTPGADD